MDKVWLLGPVALRVVAACLVLLASTAVMASSLSPQESRAHAERAIDLLLDQGNRPAAIAEALRGLPDGVNEEDITAYPEAWTALWRAFASRSIRIDLPGDFFTVGFLSPGGRRALITQQISGSIDPNARVSVHLVDQATNRVINSFISSQPIGAAWTSMGHAAFSPDGTLGIVSLGDGQTILFDAETGIERGRIQSDAIMILFSPDGRHVVLKNQNGASVFSVGTGEHVLRFPDPFVSPSAWASDGSILAANISQETGRARIVAYRLDGTARVVLDNIDAPQGNLKASPSAPVFAIGTGTQTMLYGLDGTRLALVVGDIGDLRFARNGQVISFMRGSDSMRISDVNVEVFAMDGTPLATQPRDFVDFNQAIYAPDGSLAGFMVTQNHAGLLADSIPTGPALYEAAKTFTRKAGTGAAVSIADETVDPLVETSDRFAREAERLLLSGDRQGAILAALKGLPDTPTADDLSRFKAAHLLLYRSVAARVLRLPLGQPPFPITNASGGVVSPTGDVMAVTSEVGAQLYAMPEGTFVAELRKPDGSGILTWSYPFFSSTGDIVAVTEQDGATLHFFDGRTGTHKSSVTIPVPDVQGLLENYSGVVWPIGFSHDDSTFAVQTPKGSFLTNMADLSVHSLPLPERRNFELSWLPDGRLFAFEPVPSYRKEQNAAEVFIHDRRALRHIFSIPRDPNWIRSEGGAVLSRQGTAIFASDGGSERIVVFDAAGTPRLKFSDSDGYHAFVRDGTAIAYRDPAGTLQDSLKVISLLTGERVPSEFQDYPVFDQTLFDMDGISRQGESPHLGAPRYRGQDVPTGTALIDRAMSNLSQAEQAEVRNERISPN
ncbi:hypothetical protein I5535_18500 [Rhodobacteraceae bacterium F11138]|nr:hypothetical protein [Rhodobacteraceae bacterium F11138]